MLKYEELYEPGYNKLHELKLIFLPIHQKAVNYELLFSKWLDYNDFNLLEMYLYYKLALQKHINVYIPFSKFLKLNELTLFHE